RRMAIGHKVLLLSAVLALAQPAGAADVFTLSSANFKDGQLLPRKVGDIPARGPNCKGENVSPQLSWANPPEGTRSFAVVMFDPDAGYGAGLVHWVGYGVAPSVDLVCRRRNQQSERQGCRRHERQEA